MIETIFRVILIVIIIAIVLAVACTLGITFDFPFEYTVLLLSFLHIVCYVIPFTKLLPIFVTVVSIVVFKVGIALLKTIWDLFPLRG